MHDWKFRPSPSPLIVPPVSWDLINRGPSASRIDIFRLLSLASLALNLRFVHLAAIQPSHIFNMQFIKAIFVLSHTRQVPRRALWTKFYSVLERTATPPVWAHAHSACIKSIIDLKALAPKIPSDRSGYPWFELYPAVQATSEKAVKATSSEEPFVARPVDRTGYPFFELYPAVAKPSDRSGYPWFELYPAIQVTPEIFKVAPFEESFVAQPVDRTGYPLFELYPAVVKAEAKEAQAITSEAHAAPEVIDRSGYPYFELYPAVAKIKEKNVQLITYEETAAAPVIDRSGYPHFELYPAIVKVDRTGYPFFELYPAVEKVEDAAAPGSLVAPSQSEALAATVSATPTSNLRAPSLHESSEHTNCMSISLLYRYPGFAIRKTMYPLMSQSCRSKEAAKSSVEAAIYVLFAIEIAKVTACYNIIRDAVTFAITFVAKASPKLKAHEQI
ncbi:hypothetical protein BOTBODRAFT_185801 [Botryobasidium botryosum FD-172 SS1]|uniref:Uncharacterized protein n=1 Tax=Botryobasidium botryosum (strain FD-172 SS1) TaxID=930990 RepID=A0A067MPN0_BOTB1|nr:hypothetical protein BOTBODRAFT_185801 [Botryobasidium botryosum FD-172 SS1]